MIVLDTNVLSALMREAPDARVIAWLDEQPAESVWITSITLLEAHIGLALLATGRRRAALTNALSRVLSEDLDRRILEFDASAAVAAAELAARRRGRGLPVDVRDTMIAGIVIAHRAVIATRNVRHFDDLGVPVVDPWGPSMHSSR